MLLKLIIRRWKTAIISTPFPVSCLQTCQQRNSNNCCGDRGRQYCSRKRNNVQFGGTYVSTAKSSMNWTRSLRRGQILQLSNTEGGCIKNGMLGWRESVRMFGTRGTSLA